MRYRPKHIAEYAAIRAIAATVNILPYRAALALGWVLARAAFLLWSSRVREAQRRIAAVLGSHLSPDAVRRIAWQSLRNITFTGIEFLRTARQSPAWLDRVSNFRPALRQAQARLGGPRAAIFTVGHSGNWEMAAVALQSLGVELLSVTGAQRNPLVNAYMDRLRGLHGMRRVPRGSGALRAAVRHLQAGGSLALMPDVRVPTEGVRVPFLGGEANVGPGAAAFARHVKAPLVMCYATRQGWARHRLDVLGIIDPDPTLDRDRDIQRMTATVIRALDDAIRRDPGQWFWYNKRWILDPLQP